MSLKKAIQILALRKGELSSPQKGKETIIAQIQTPTVMLRSYSGDALNVMAQLPMILGQGDQEVSSVILIQKDAPQDLLIGTDLQPALDYMLTVKKSGNREVVLLGNHKSDTLLNEATKKQQTTGK